MITSKSDIGRLRTLYTISKILSNIKRVEDSFAEILHCASESFPLSSAVFVEHWEERVNTSIWSAENVPSEVTTKAIENAKNAYSFFSGLSRSDADAFLKTETGMNTIFKDDKAIIFNENENGYYITIPLVIDNLPPKGVLQMEGTSSLDEKDLDFVIALGSLMGVAFDRFYQTKKNRESLKSKVQYLEHERELRESFVNLLTHDLRTPISVALGAAQIILRRPEDVESTKKHAELIVTHIKRTSRMVTDLLDANLIRSGQALETHKEKTDLTKLIAKTIAELSLTHGERFVFLNTQSIELSIDAHGIRRIIENLCNNAIKYGSPHANVRVELEESPDSYLLSVANQGSFIPPEEQQSLFEQFRRSNSIRGTSVKGWGIGLTLVLGVAEAHGGNVSVTSSRENGTVFTVTLPKAKSI